MVNNQNSKIENILHKITRINLNSQYLKFFIPKIKLTLLSHSKILLSDFILRFYQKNEIIDEQDEDNDDEEDQEENKNINTKVLNKAMNDEQSESLSIGAIFSEENSKNFDKYSDNKEKQMINDFIKAFIKSASKKIFKIWFKSKTDLSNENNQVAKSSKLQRTMKLKRFEEF